ncbi:MAG: hypothetical protein HFI10_02995 [Lachnospiraceae bacterium]|nr:hypothetical protein [Lachnospiraceae bacterium]
MGRKSDNVCMNLIWYDGGKLRYGKGAMPLLFAQHGSSLTGASPECA